MVSITYDLYKSISIILVCLCILTNTKRSLENLDPEHDDQNKPRKKTI